VGALLASLLLAAAAAVPGPELTGFVGYRSGASLEGADADPAPSFALSYGWWVKPDGWLELFYERQTLDFERFDLGLDTVQLAGGYEPPGEGLRPYVTLGAGIAWYGADPGSVDESLGLAGSIAGGFKAPLGRRTLLRLEARGYASFSSSSAAVVCGPGCVVAFGGEGIGQLGVRAGIVYRLR
jgi:hypothetical protein